MKGGNVRRSDRIALELPTQVSGTDCMGDAFVEETRTLLLSRHGAKILLERKLVPDQEVAVLCKSTGRESAARVVGQIGRSREGFFYGIEFLDSDVNLWDIEFPPLSESEKGVVRILLECVRCHAREVTYLDGFEAEVFEANRCLSRPCKRCTDVSVWKLCAAGAATEQTSLPQPPEVRPEPREAWAVRTTNEWQGSRVSLRIRACIRTPDGGEEIVVTENVSRAGFAFKSARSYSLGSAIEAAVPYASGAGNIFAPGRIERLEDLPTESVTLYSVSYIRIHRGWPGS